MKSIVAKLIELFRGLSVNKFVSLNHVEDNIKNSERWKKLPLSENLEQFVYTPYDSNLEIPKIKNGYYYFYDRHFESENSYDDSELVNRNSFNFTLAIYDSDSNSLYFVEYDT